jgi:predicted phage terminase large subunit-like protein
MDQSDILAAARRSNLIHFLTKCFETLHPAEPTLGSAWYLDAICHALEEVAAGRKKRLVITVPPRHLKSITTSVAFVAWLLGRNPSFKIMVASYSQDLARLHAGQCRTIMESDWYQRLFPNTRISERGNRAMELITTAGGVRKAVSVGGSITGFGADLIIIDDCMKADEVRSQTMRDEVKGWFENTLLTRLNDKAEGRICSIQQRLHEDDLPAYLLEKSYEHLNLPSIAERHERIEIRPGVWHERSPGDILNPARESAELLQQLRRELGPAVFCAQYQQEPVTPEGNLLRLELFGTYDEAPEREYFLKVVQSWDTGMTAAPTSDYSVCTTWGFNQHNKWLLLDVFRERLDYPDLKRAVIRLRHQWQADKVLLEDANSGKSLHQELRRVGPFTPLMCLAREDKETRLISTLGEVEAGRFLLPREASWLDAFRSELRAFPSARHDDQVDSFSQFVRYQLLNWKWVLTRYDQNGRPDRIIRRRSRPY